MALKMLKQILNSIYICSANLAWFMKIMPGFWKQTNTFKR